MTDQEQALKLHEFAQALERRQLELRLKKHSRVWKPTATAATQLGYECERRIAYGRVMPWAAEPISAELASIFEEGDYHEKQVLRELEEDLGIKLRERQSTFRDQTLDIVGTIDAEALVEGVGWVPAEVKGLAFIPGDDVEGVDLADAPRALHRRYFSQLQTYLVLRAKPLGLFIFKSKSTGRWRVIPVALDYEHAEQLLKKAERVRDAVRAFQKTFTGTGLAFTQDGPPDGKQLEEAPDWLKAIREASGVLPDRMLDRSECGSCPYRKRCNPSQAPVNPALLVLDEELIDELTRREEAKPFKSAYEKVHEKVRKRFELTGGDVFFVGPFKVAKVKWGKSWKLEVTRQGTEATRGSAAE